jgi:hypothetical protein
MKLVAFIAMLALLALPALAFVFEDTLLVGESRNYTTPAGYHQVVLVTVSELERGAIFSVNGEYSEDIQENEEVLFEDGSHIRVDDIIYGKRSYVEFSFSPGRGIPVPSAVGLAGSAQENTTLPACTADAGCDDGNPCTKDTCTGEPAICAHAAIPDCGAMTGARQRLPAAEPEGAFSRAVKWLAGLFRRIFG